MHNEYTLTTHQNNFLAFEESIVQRITGSSFTVTRVRERSERKLVEAWGVAYLARRAGPAEVASWPVASRSHENDCDLLARTMNHQTLHVHIRQCCGLETPPQDLPTPVHTHSSTFYTPPKQIEA